MIVHFIGAGPGAADLITLRGRDLIARCPVCLYAGSIVPRELLTYCPKAARIVDTAPLSLDEIEAEFVAAHEKGLDVARLHSGDLSVYSALAEQLRRLRTARHSLQFDAGRSGLRRSSGGNRVRIDRARDRAERRADPRPGARLAHARRREARRFRCHGSDACHPFGHPRHRRCRERAQAFLWRRLSGRGGGRGKPGERAHRARHTRRYRRQRSPQSRSSARR